MQEIGYDYNEESRIQSVYAKRDAENKDILYSWKSADAIYIDYRKRVTWSLAFLKAGLNDLVDLEILDVGCGSGGWLRMLLEWGATPKRLHGIDLLEDRISRAKALSQINLDFRLGNSCQLPWPDCSIDLCGASTVFSSVIDGRVRSAIASECSRVLKPGGWMMVFDFAISDPRNPDTVGVGRKAIIKLFPKLRIFNVLRLIFCPPILRVIPHQLFFLAHFLEIIFPLICTHRLYLLRK